MLLPPPTPHSRVGDLQLPHDPAAILDSGDTVDEEDAPPGIELIGHHEDVSNLLKVRAQLPTCHCQHASHCSH